MAAPAPLIFDLSLPQLESIFKDWGEPTFRTKQLWQGLYQQLWGSSDACTTLPKTLRDRLATGYSFSHLQTVAEQHSSDQLTTKTLFYLPGNHPIETVLMEYDERRTLCISTQSGCAIGCQFCATGQMGFRRSLTAGEIIEQALYFARQLKLREERLTNIVFMGMGEPFLNYEAVLAAIDCLNNAQGFNLGARHFTISTVGLPDSIRRFAKEKSQVNLAISLHAATDDIRTQLIPINRKYPLVDLMSACREYISLTHRRLTFEWALIAGINDTPQQAQALVRLLKGMVCHVNLIPVNPTHSFRGQPSQPAQTEAFSSILKVAGIPCTVRLRRGIDIQAGCGQLAERNKASG